VSLLVAVREREQRGGFLGGDEFLLRVCVCVCVCGGWVARGVGERRVVLRGLVMVSYRSTNQQTNKPTN
jgi:hypothetical protein